jgi:hypothetical protein
MTLRQYYVGTKQVFAHATVKGVHHEHVSNDSIWVGHVLWHGKRNSDRLAFESQDGVICLGSLLTPTLPAQALTVLAPFGVTEKDNVASALEKVQKKFGGFTIQL